MMTIERTYGLHQASILTGFSEGRFRYNKELLIQNGAEVSSDGWSIPHETLEKMGWIGVKAPRGPVAPPTKLEIATARIAELEKENAALREAAAPRSIFGRKKK